MEEDIKILEDYLDKNDRKVVSIKRCKFLKAIENLLERNKELEEKQELIYELEEKDHEIKCANRDIKVFETDFIPKSKIIEKIEELNKQAKIELKGLKGQDRYFVKHIYQTKRNVLQELLEEKGDETND